MSCMGPGAGGSGGGTPVAWNNTRENGTGVGLLHTIGANAPSGVVSVKTVLDDSQSNILAAHEIDLGLSPVGHVGLLMAAKGNSESQRAIIVDMGNGPGSAFFAGGVGGFRGVNIVPGTSNADHVGYNYETNHNDPRGAAIRINAESAGVLNNLKVMEAYLVSQAQTNAKNRDVFELSFLSTIPGAPSFTDNFNLAYFKRGVSATSGTVSSEGAVLKLENQTSPAITDNVKVLEIVQDADAGGYPILITQNAVIATNFKAYQSLDGLIIYKSINGTTPNGNLPANVGDICLNGPGGKIFYCSGGTNWT